MSLAKLLLPDPDGFNKKITPKQNFKIKKLNVGRSDAQKRADKKYRDEKKKRLLIAKISLFPEQDIIFMCDEAIRIKNEYKPSCCRSLKSIL